MEAACLQLCIDDENALHTVSVFPKSILDANAAFGGLVPAIRLIPTTVDTQPCIFTPSWTVVGSKGVY